MRPLRRFHGFFGLVIALGVLAAALLFACERYEPPPLPTVLGLSGSTLEDPSQPITVDFGKAIDLSTLQITVAYYDLDIEGNLPDEQDPPIDNRVVIGHDNAFGDRGGHIELDPNGSTVRLIPVGKFPVGPKLVLLVEPGLKATDGRELVHRVRIPFSYVVKCGSGARADKLASGVYFLLLEVEQPLGSQIQLFGTVDVDPGTGLVVAQFTNADRNTDGARCPTPCGSSDACRLLPAPECVPPSTKAASVDEHTDFVPNPTPPTGYSFFVEGCAVDGDNGAGLVTAPASMVVESPPVTIAGLIMTAFFTPDANGVVHATGSLTADAVSLSGNLIGPGKGTMNAVLIPAGEIPPGVPAPPPAADGGADAGH